jgi:hypothetical protein
LVESANEETMLSFQNFGKKFGKHIDFEKTKLINRYRSYSKYVRTSYVISFTIE